MHRKYRRRGVSPVIAVLMLIAIAVATGIIVYIEEINLSGLLTKSGGTHVVEQIELETYNWTSSSILSIHIRNTGGRTVTVAEIYVDGINQSILPRVVGVYVICTALAPNPSCVTHIVTAPPILTIAPQDTITITVAISGVVGGVGTIHTVKIITTDGGIFTYSIVKGKSK